MKLTELTSDIPFLSVRAGSDGNQDPDIRSLEYDSRKVRKGSLFFAIRGLVTDGHRFLPQALERGAVGVVSEQPAPASFPVCWLRVPSVRSALAWMAHRFYGEPSCRLILTGITGTNGKTTTAYLLHSVLNLSAPALLMGTIRTLWGGQERESLRTTPEAPEIQAILREALGAGCPWGVLEVSSHALALDRVFQCRFPVAVFTNLSEDHLDFHSTMEEYLQAKSRLFRRSYNPGLRVAVLNGDDPVWRRIPREEGVRVLTYGFSEGCQVRPLSWRLSTQGTELELAGEGRRLRISSPLIGQHNLYNILAAVAAAQALELPQEQIVQGIRDLARVPGRFERVQVEKPYTVVVDYAHTPDALGNVLELARSLTRSKLICVFGCGGDRDRAKRPLMGEIAARLADRVILTSDNPRSEDPWSILRQIEEGIPAGSSYEVVEDRREAIGRALESAAEGDFVLIAGKGHETYQEMAGRRVPFDDRQVVRELC